MSLYAKLCDNSDNNITNITEIGTSHSTVGLSTGSNQYLHSSHIDLLVQLQARIQPAQEAKWWLVVCEQGLDKVKRIAWLLHSTDAIFDHKYQWNMKF